MKKLLFVFAAFCAGSLMFSACEEHTTTGEKPTPPEEKDLSYDASKFVEEHSQSLSETFNLQVGDWGQLDTLQLQNGMRLIIPNGGQIFTKDGTTITGSYDVVVTCMITPSEVIFGGVNTNFSGGQYLNTGGFFKIDVLQDGVSVDPYFTGAIIGQIPIDDPNDPWSLWTADDPADGEQFAWNDVEAREVDSVGAKEGQWIFNEPNISTTWKAEGYFSFTFSKLAWYNCDMLFSYIKNGVATTIQVFLSGLFGELAAYQGYGNGTTFVFFIGDGYKVIAQIYTPVDATTVKSYENSMPTGATGKLIAFSVEEGTFAYAEQTITVSANANYSLNLQEITKEQLEEKIKALDQ